MCKHMKQSKESVQLLGLLVEDFRHLQRAGLVVCGSKIPLISFIDLRACMRLNVIFSDIPMSRHNTDWKFRYLTKNELNIQADAQLPLNTHDIIVTDRRRE